MKIKKFNEYYIVESAQAQVQIEDVKKSEDRLEIDYEFTVTIPFSQMPNFDKKKPAFEGYNSIEIYKYLKKLEPINLAEQFNPSIEDSEKIPDENGETTYSKKK